MQHTLITGDCVRLPLEDDAVDSTFTSPPYGSQRSYGIDFVKDDEEWVQWTADRFMEALRVTKGLVAFVVEGYMLKGTFHPLPELLTAELYRRGANIRNRAIYKRNGIPGGNPDSFARHHEMVVCASKHGGPLHYADPKACGHAPKFGPGGNMTHRTRQGRVDGSRSFKPPAVCKASDVIDCGAAGGGNIGSRLASENEAPFPEQLAERFVRSYCPEGGTVLDPFCGSGTVMAVAERWGRDSVGVDIRESQIELTQRRIEEVRDAAAA